MNQKDTTLIVGTNGAGKSTVLDALTFSLFNKPFRKISKGQLTNSTNEKDCRVEVEFSIGPTLWKVVRGIKPNIFEIWALFAIHLNWGYFFLNTKNTISSK